MSMPNQIREWVQANLEPTRIFSFDASDPSHLLILDTVGGYQYQGRYPTQEDSLLACRHHNPIPAVKGVYLLSNETGLLEFMGNPTEQFRPVPEPWAN